MTIKIFRKAILILILLFIQLSCFGQNIPALLKADGFDLQASGDVYGAIEKFKLYCDKRPDDGEIAFHLASLYERTRDYYRAASFYQKAYNSEPDAYAIAKFHEARMRKMTGAYETALQGFYTYRDNTRSIDKNIREQLEMEIKGCLQADSIRNKPLKIDIKHLNNSINKVYSEFSPWPLNDTTLLYASFRTDSFVQSNFGLPEKQFYLATKRNGQWEGGKEFPGPFNSSNSITGNGCLTDDGDRFYFTKCNYSVNDQLRCALYMSRKMVLGWSRPKKLNKDINLTGYSSSQPAVGPDPRSKSKEILYFITDRPDGNGGKDIWFTVYDTKEDDFSEVRNAGNSINSPGNETSPFYNAANSVLYFSSDGWPGLGGLDIFKSTGSKKNWTEPTNLGYPLNSSADDLYFTVVKDRREGFFVSNRTGSVSYKDFNCCDDIYSYKWTEYTAMTVLGSIGALLSDNPKEMSPEFRSDITNDSLMAALPKLVPNLVDSVTGLINLDPDTSTFFAILDKTRPRLNWEDSLTLFHKLGTIDELIQQGKDKEVQREFQKLKNLGINLDKKDWESYVEGRKKEFTNIREMIETGLVDPQTAYIKVRDKVQKLDYRKTYISLYVLDPIDKRPVLLKNDSVWPDGKFKLEVEPGNDYLLIAESPQFLRKSFRFSTHDMQWSDSLNLDIKLDPITDKPIVLSNIYFDFDSDVLNPAVKEYLDSTLYMVLVDNPEITIEISAHTDSKGADDYNKKLSQRRADSVVAYLRSKGINPKKLIAKGYGEEQPIAPNTNPDGSDNPEGRKENRRVEFRILQ